MDRMSNDEVFISRAWYVVCVRNVPPCKNKELVVQDARGGRELLT